MPHNFGVSLREYIETKLDSLDEKADRIIDFQESSDMRLQAAERKIAVLTWAYGAGAAVIGWVVVEIVKK